MKKKLLFVTTRLFWPTDSGRKVSLYHYCKSFAYDYGYDVHLYSFLEDGQKLNENQVPAFIKSVSIAKDVSKLEVIKNILCHSVGNEVWPLQNCLFYSRDNSAKIKKECEEIKPDVVVIDMLRLGEYFDSFKDTECIKVLDMDDLLSSRYKRMISNGSEGDIGGVYSQKIGCMPSSNWLKTLILREELRRLKHAEKRLSTWYDSVVFVSNSETETLNRRLGVKKAITATLGVDFEYYSECEPLIDAPRDISFLGNYRYSPNVESLKYIINYILPHISRDCRVIAIGDAPEYVRKQFSSDQVVFTGKVKDFRPIVSNTRVFLAPVLSGSGIKTKILEAMAMGMPVVTNSIGAEGLNVSNGNQLVVLDKDLALAKVVSKLLDDAEERARLGQNAREYIKNNHIWENVLTSFKEIGL